jgi:hypothetical protein
MSWEPYLKASKSFAKIAFDRNEDPTVRVQNAFKAVEFAIAACAIKFGKNRPERGKELLFIELNFGAKARDEFKAMMTAYYDSYGIVSAQRAEYVCSKTKALLTTIYATIGERFELK